MLKPARAVFAALVLVCSNATTGVAFQDSGTWSITEEPLMRIGWVAGQPNTEFFDVVGAARLPDGAVAIADRGLPKVTVVEADGSVRFAVGGSGDGPEGFADLEQVLVDDSGHIHAFDARHQRLTEWTDAGALVSTATLSRAAQRRRLDAVGRFEGGSWYGREATRLAGTPVGGTARDTVRFFRLDADGVGGEKIAEAPGMVATQVMVGGQAATRHTMFSPRALDTQFGNCLLLMTSDVPTIRVTRPDGELFGEIRIPISIRRTTESDRQAWIDGIIEANEVPPEAAPMIVQQVPSYLRPDALVGGGAGTPVALGASGIVVSGLEQDTTRLLSSEASNSPAARQRFEALHRELGLTRPPPESRDEHAVVVGRREAGDSLVGQQLGNLARVGRAIERRQRIDDSLGAG